MPFLIEKLPIGCKQIFQIFNKNFKDQVEFTFLIYDRVNNVSDKQVSLKKADGIVNVNIPVLQLALKKDRPMI